MHGRITIGVLVLCSAAACGGGRAGGTERRPAAPLDPLGVAFASRDDGLAVAGGTIESTADGGRTWAVRRRGSQPLAAVTFAPGGTAIVTIGRCSETCTDGGGLLASTDGGRTWSARTHERVFRPSFATASVGWALTGGHGDAAGPARTGDGGRRWTTLADPCPPVAPIADAVAALGGRSAEVLCVSGNGATNMEAKALLRTRSAGRAWSTLDVAEPPGAPPPRAAAHGLPAVGLMPGMIILPDGHGWLWADRGTLAATRDGVRWHGVTAAFRPDVDVVRSVDFLDGRAGYALAWRGGATRLLRSGDGGRTWTAVHAWARATG
jgi:photosystem II stability/assembly factor-like uncharacterized protein